MEDPIIEEDRIRFSDGLEIMIQAKGTAEMAKRDDVYYMMKSRPYLDSYANIRDLLSKNGKIENALEIGVFRGGSAPYLHRFFGPKTLSCVDIVPDVIPLNRYAAQVAPAVKVHYKTDQSDKAALRKIIEEDFSGPIDLVVDDASHYGDLTKATFEAVFPHLRHGGVYVVEDWAWSHDNAAQNPAHHWWRKEACTNLVFELLATYGNGASGLFSAINIAPGLMWVVKGWAKTPEDFKLSDFTNLRGRHLEIL